MKAHQGIASNTRECFSTFIGCKVVGVLFDALPLSDSSLASGTTTLIFEDGYGLTISSEGSYWLESPDEIKRAIERKKDELEATQNELRGVLQLAGAWSITQV